MIIINADDFGVNVKTNKAICYCFKKGFITSTTMLCNGKGFNDAINRAKKLNIVSKIGLHFNLDSGFPLTERIKKCNRICDSEGKFIYKRNSIWLWTKEEKRCIKEELIAQIKILRNNGVPISHFDSHHHIHTEIFLFLILFRILKNNGINKVRISRNDKKNIYSLKYIYKAAFNKILKILNFTTTKEFYSLSTYYSLDTDKDNYVSIELMCHPTMISNQIVDSSGHEFLKVSGNLISYNEL